MAKTYTTVQGDMWDSIAFAQMGSVDHTDKLMNANLRYREIYIFPAGIVLTIPEVKESVSSSLPPWKKVGYEQ
jgi:phage tail protein X